MLVLLADVLGAAEHEHRVVAVARRASHTDVPLHELVTALADHVAEQLGSHVGPVGDRDHPHATGTCSSSSNLRSSWAPAAACATPFVWLLLLKNAYASSAPSARSRSGSTHSRSSSSP